MPRSGSVQLLPGWRLVTRSGIVVDDLGVVRPAPGGSVLERRAILEEVERRRARVREQLETALAAVTGPALRSAAGSRLAQAREAVEAARRARRLADDLERSAASSTENAGRELAWQEALLERARGEAAAGAEEARLRTEELAAHDRASAGDGEGQGDRAAVAAIDARLAALRDERDGLARRAADARATRERPSNAPARRGRPGPRRGSHRRAGTRRGELGLTGRDVDLAAERERHSTATGGRQARLRQDARPSRAPSPRRPSRT